MKKWIIIAAVAVLALVIISGSCFYTVAENA